jgi:tetratricopeptide (TPR) repeat protein
MLLTEALLVAAGSLVLLPLVVMLATSLAYARGWWRLLRLLSGPAPYLFGRQHGAMMAFQHEATALRELGRLPDAIAFAKARLADPAVPPSSRNTAIDVLISAGAYQAALDAEPRPRMPTGAQEAMALALIQVNLAEAEYNLGRWEQAEQRLRPLDLGCWLFPIARAGLLQQRAWIAAHRGRGSEALELCDRVKPHWLPRMFRAEYHFTRAAALLAQGRSDEAARAISDGERLALRRSSRRNALLLRARLVAARGDWRAAERLCRAAAQHSFQGQGGDGLLLWARALERLGRPAEAADALRLVVDRDPESGAARSALDLLARSPGPAAEPGRSTA